MSPPFRTTATPARSARTNGTPGTPSPTTIRWSFWRPGNRSSSSVRSFAWTPNANCFWWNWDDVDGHVGTAFLPITTTATIRIAERFASEVARLNPARKVCVVNIAKGGQDISHWMTGASAPDMFANIVANVVPALASIGKTAIDGLLWYHGVSQTGEPYRYPENFETVMARFQAQSWFPRTTPVLVVGIAPTSISDDIATDVDQCPPAGRGARRPGLPALCRHRQPRRELLGRHGASQWGGLQRGRRHGGRALRQRAGEQRAARSGDGLPAREGHRPAGLPQPDHRGRFQYQPVAAGDEFLTGLTTNNTFTADRWAYNVSGLPLSILRKPQMRRQSLKPECSRSIASTWQLPPPIHQLRQVTSTPSPTRLRG